MLIEVLFIQSLIFLFSISLRDGLVCLFHKHMIHKKKEWQDKQINKQGTRAQP